MSVSIGVRPDLGSHALPRSATAARTLLPTAQQSNDSAAYTELRAFVALAEELSFTRASIRLGRDPTVLTRRVAALEARLCTRLLERTTRAVRLTEAGGTYLDRSRAIAAALEDAARGTVDWRSAKRHGRSFTLRLCHRRRQQWLDERPKLVGNNWRSHPLLWISHAASYQGLEMNSSRVGFESASVEE